MTDPRLPARHIARQSFNLGWSFAEYELPDRLRAAAGAGFGTVELHFPYDVPAATLRRVIDAEKLKLVSINAPRGVDDQFGFAALPGAEAAFDASVALALDTAEGLGAGMVHVLAGKALVTRETEAIFVRNIRRAAEQAAQRNIVLLLEPLNAVHQPGYFLSRVGQAVDLMAAIGAENVRLMFDFCHVAIMEADPLALFRRHLDAVGHVQIGAVPDRSEPDQGHLDYNIVYDLLDAVGYAGRIGAEYRPRGGTRDGLVWMDRLGILR